jgi:hypothetical protein
MDLRWRGSFTFYASITMSKHKIDLHHMSYIKRACLCHNSAYATISDYYTIDASHTTLILINPLSTWSHIRDHMCVRKRSLRRPWINDPRYCTVAIVVYIFLTAHFALATLTFSTFCQLHIFFVPHNLH